MTHVCHVSRCCPFIRAIQSCCTGQTQYFHRPLPAPTGTHLRLPELSSNSFNCSQSCLPCYCCRCASHSARCDIFRFICVTNQKKQSLETVSSGWLGWLGWFATQFNAIRSKLWTQRLITNDRLRRGPAFSFFFHYFILVVAVIAFRVSLVIDIDVTPKIAVVSGYTPIHLLLPVSCPSPCPFIINCYNFINFPPTFSTIFEIFSIFASTRFRHKSRQRSYQTLMSISSSSSGEKQVTLPNAIKQC